MRYPIEICHIHRILCSQCPYPLSWTSQDDPSESLVERVGLPGLQQYLRGEPMAVAVWEGRASLGALSVSETEELWRAVMQAWCGYSTWAKKWRDALKAAASEERNESELTRKYIHDISMAAPIHERIPQRYLSCSEICQVQLFVLKSLKLDTGYLNNELVWCGISWI